MLRLDMRIKQTRAPMSVPNSAANIDMITVVCIPSMISK